MERMDDAAGAQVQALLQERLDDFVQQFQKTPGFELAVVGRKEEVTQRQRYQKGQKTSKKRAGVRERRYRKREGDRVRFMEGQRPLHLPIFLT